MRRKAGGVTLIELLIVVIIIGILASIAIPSYRQYVLRSHRVDAKTVLLNIAAAQEKFYLQNNRYAVEAELSVAPPNGLGIALDADRKTATGWYLISLQVDDETDPQTWTATADAQSPEQDKDSKCLEFSLTHDGKKDATNADCWG